MRPQSKLFPLADLAWAAVLVPIVERPEGLQVMLTLRASHLKNHAGQVSFPGGRVESHDAGPWEAALREAYEEIGLEPRFIQRAGLPAGPHRDLRLPRDPGVAFVDPAFTLSLDTTEVEDVFEVPLDFILDPDNHLRVTANWPARRSSRTTSSTAGRQIWGATANMLITLYRMLREPRHEFPRTTVAGHGTVA